jgi:PncC family amidohydrolase
LSLETEARKLALALEKKNLKIVFAESCTAGMVAATLAQTPGISRFLCGSAVVYRDATKSSWLGISKKILRSSGAVSRETAIAMARQVLRKTREADVAAAITGDLGPLEDFKNAGIVFVAVARRGRSNVSVKKFHLLPQRHSLGAKPALRLRIKRQALASQSIISMVRSLL